MLPLLAPVLALAALLLPPPPAGCPAPGGRPRVLLLGDSNIYAALGSDLEARLRADGWIVDRFARSGSGLARPDFFDWLGEAGALVDAFQPDAVLFMAGGNDGQRLQPAAGEARSVPWSAEATWRAEYARRVASLALVLSRGARPVWWLSPTNRRSPHARAKMGRIRAVQEAALRGLPDATWIDMFPPSSDAGDRELSRMKDAHGRVIPLRARDGVHLTAAGGRVVAGRLMEILHARGFPAGARGCPPVEVASVLPPEGRQGTRARAARARHAARGAEPLFRPGVDLGRPALRARPRKDPPRRR